jgi:penicillin-binding protein 2
MSAERPKKRHEGPERRVRMVAMALLGGFALLGLRLWDLQIVHWSDYRQMAECNRLHPQRLVAPRGMIYGPEASVVLADNRPSCDLVIVPAECKMGEVENVCHRLARLIGIDAGKLRDAIIAQKGKRQAYAQILVKRDVSKEELMRVEEASYALPGLFTVARPQRRYLYGNTASQILGYMGEISSDELDRTEEYQMGDLIGRGGLERMYESSLRGTDGQLVVSVYLSDRRPQLRTDAYGQPYVEIDSYGRRLKEESEFRLDPTAGEPIFTTLDIDLQRHCEELLGDEVGAVVVLDADTGAVLALASTPSYDPNLFVTRGRDAEYNRAQRMETLTTQPNPMTHRGYRETYAPGSTFKVMLATAALEEGVINENTTFFCPGFYQLEGVERKWHCWNHHGHGTVSVVDALAYSCDVFFYNVGVRLGPDRINEWARKLGLGIKTGIDLPGEVEGLIPSREWKEARQKELYPNNPWEWRWYPGNTVNLAIGQGEAATTPLQCAVMMAAIVNGGHRVRPFINEALGPSPSEALISERTLKIVQAGLRKCVEKDAPPPTGTGKAAKIPGMIVLGKTGSAQMVSLEQHKEFKSEEDIPYDLRDHAWFVSGVLDREPKIALCILIEHGHHGSSAAAPLAKKVMEYFYGPREQGPISLAKQER